MSALDAWIARTGMDPETVKRRAVAGVLLGLAVVAAQRLLGFGS